MTAEVAWDFTATCHVCGVETQYRAGRRVDDRCEHVVGVIYDHEEAVADLLTMERRAFEQAVSDDARDQLPEPTAKALRDPRLNDRWDQALTTLNLRVNAQLASRGGDRSRETKAWRGRVLFFQSGLHARRKECHAAKYESPEQRAVRRLIDAHREEFRALIADEEAS